MQTPISPPETAPKTVSATPIIYPWLPDQKDGTYSNPVICADYSDPDVIRDGADFYLVASSFNCTPGLPILHSRDLVSWKIINHALKNLPHPRYEQVQRGCGVWAPAIRYHAKKFWIFFPTPDEGIFVTTAMHPGGQWSEPHLVQAGRGLIDPCPLWDDDGKAYLVHAYANSRAGIKNILRVCPMAPNGSRLLDEGKIVFHAPEKHPTLEGPKFLKKDGWYYIFAPAGGVATGWQVVLRSKNIFGPYEDKVVLEQGSTPVNGPHQGALVDTAKGDWWFVHFQDAGAYGRITHLQPAAWQDGWPLIGVDLDGNGIGEPVLNYYKPSVATNAAPVIPQTTDEFDSPRLGLQWQWFANHQPAWHSLDARPGWLRLISQIVSQADLAKAPNLLLQKFPARAFAAETLLDFSATENGDEAGLVVIGETYAALSLRHNDIGPQIVFRINDTVHFSRPLLSPQIRLRVAVSDGGHCQFSFTDSRNQTIPIPFQALPFGWIGAKLGLYSLKLDAPSSSHADFDYFRFSSP